MTEHRCNPGRIERRLAKPMFILAVAYLLLLAGVIYRGRDFGPEDWDAAEARILVGGVLVLWPVFLLEALLRFCLHDRDRRTLRTFAGCLSAGLLPPLRLGTHSARDPECMWLPWLGWVHVEFDLQKQLERVFSGPMLLMAFLILPVLTIEYFWAAAIEDRPGLRMFLSASISLIWFAFTLEFVIRISAAEKKISYAVNHWVDLAVVLLPTIEFLPFLRVVRITRAMRFEGIMSWVKYYRLYGLAGKGWRGLVGLKLLQYLFSRSTEARKDRLLAQLESRLDERRELDRHIDYYRRQLEALDGDGAETAPAGGEQADEIAQGETPPA